MATNQIAPGQIQLEVQVNQQYDQQYTQQPQLPQTEPREETPEPSPDPEEKPNSCLAYMAFICVMLMFLWPFILTFVNYYTDYNLWTFIKSTANQYEDARNSIKSDTTNITTVTCTWDGDNTLQSFQDFQFNNTVNTGCNCTTTSGTDIVGIDCESLNQRSDTFTTNNWDYQLCLNWQNDINSACVVCTSCDADTVYSAKSPQFLYSQQLYDELDSDEEKEKYCSPSKTRDTVNSDGLDSMQDKLNGCAIACIVFFCLSGIWILCGLCTGCKVRYKDLYRTYLWCIKGLYTIYLFVCN